MKLVHLLVPMASIMALILVTVGDVSSNEDDIVSEAFVEIDEEFQDSNPKESSSSRVGEEKDESQARLFHLNTFKGSNHQVAYDYVTNVQNTKYYWVLFTTMYLASQAILIVCHFLFWDYSQTRNSEKFTPINLYNFITNPDRALENIYITLGHSAVQIAFWALPTMLWTGQEIDNGIDEDADDRLLAFTPLVQNEGDFAAGVRRFLSPNQVMTNLLINTVIFLGTITFWNVSPYFRRTQQSTRKRRDLERNLNPNVNPDTLDCLMEQMECLNHPPKL